MTKYRKMKLNDLVNLETWRKQKMIKVGEGKIKIEKYIQEQKIAESYGTNW